MQTQNTQEPQKEKPELTIFQKFAECGIDLSEPAEAMRGELEIDGDVVDNGIGSYECHGRKGFHHAYEFEVADGYGEVEIEWDEESPFHEDTETLSYCDTVTVLRKDANSEEDTEDHPIHVSATVVAFKAETRKVKHDGKTLVYWHCTATYAWEAGRE